MRLVWKTNGLPEIEKSLRIWLAASVYLTIGIGLTIDERDRQTPHDIIGCGMHSL